MSVGVYKVPPESLPARRTGFLRAGLWILVAVLAVVAAVAIYYPDSLSYETKRAMVWVIGAFVAVVVVGSHIWSFRTGSQSHKLSLEFELTNERLIQRRFDWPSVEIPLSSIRTVHERRGWLIVEGESARISIPSAIAGFGGLRQTILANRQVTPSPRPSATRVLVAFAPLAAWGVVFFATKVWLIAIAAGVALTMQAYDAFHFVKKLKHAPKNERAFVTAVLLLTWVILLWIVYLKLTGLISNSHV